MVGKESVDNGLLKARSSTMCVGRLGARPQVRVRIGTFTLGISFIHSSASMILCKCFFSFLGWGGRRGTLRLISPSVFRKIPIDADPESPHLKELRQCRLVTRESQKVIDELADSIFNAIWESCNRVSYALPPPISQSPRPFDQNLDDQAPSDSFPVSTTEPPLPFNPGFAQGFDQNFLDFSDQNLNIVGLNQPLAETFVPGHAQGFYWAPFPDYNTNIDDLDLLHRLFEEHHRSDPERGHQDHTQSCNQAFRLTPLEVASGSSGCESRQSNFTAESEGQAYAGPLLANDVSYSPDLEEYRIHRAAKHPQETTQGPDNLTDGQIRGVSPIQVTPESGIAAC